LFSTAQTIAFVPTRDPARARQFYEKTLGLAFVADDGFALVFDSNGTPIRIANVAGVPDFAPWPFTVLGWHVDDAASAVRELARRGVTCERFPGMEHDELGIWSAPGGALIAWFKDPDGNVLSVAQY